MRSVGRRKFRLLILVAFLKLLVVKGTEGLPKDVTQDSSLFSTMFIGTVSDVEGTTVAGLDRSNRCSTATVENLSTQLVAKDSVELNWTVPDDVLSCVKIIEIFVGRQKIAISKESTSYTFKDLKQCQPFELDVRIVSVDGTVGPAKEAKFPVMNTSVTFLSTTEVNISWNLLPEAVECLQSITVVGEQFERTVELNENVTVYDLKTCHIYHFDVIAKFKNGRSYKIAVDVDNRDQLSANMSISSDLVLWTFPREAFDCLESFLIRQAIPLKRLISENNYLLTNESTSGEFSYQLIDQDEKCAARIITITPQYRLGISGRPTRNTFKLAEIGPLKYEDVTVENVQGRKVMVSWKKPTLNGECAKQYRISYLDQTVWVDANESNTTISGLNACQAYLFTVELFDVEGEIKSRVVRSVTIQEEVIGSVTSLQIIENNAGILWLRWEVPDEWVYCVGSYHVEERYYDATKRGEMWNSIELTEPNATAIQLKTPHICLLTNVSVTPVSKTNISGATSYIDLRGPVQRLEVRQNASDSVTISWEPPQFVSKCITHYLVFRNGLSDPIVNTTSSQVLISDLKLCKKYVFQVVPVSESQTTHSSSEVGVLLEEHISAVRSVSTTFNLIQWEPPSEGAGCVAQYLITQTDPDSGRLLVNRTVDTRLYDLSELDTRKATDTCTVPTNVRITPISKSGILGESRELAPRLGPVRNVTIDDSVERQIELRWEPPRLCAQFVKAYRITYLEKEIIKDSTEETSVTVFGLDACVKYDFMITAINCDDVDGKERNVSATVKEEKPSIVEDLEAYEIEPRSLSAKWKPPFENGTHCVLYYRVVAWVGDNRHVFDNNTTDLHVTLGEVMACATYTVQVIPVSKTMDGLNTAVDILTKERVIMKYHIQAVRSTNQTARSLELQTSLTSENNNLCTLVMVRFICRTNVVPEGEEPKVFWGDSQISDPNATYTAVVESLEPFTEYNCTASIENNAGYSEESTAIEFRTDEDFPEYPRILNLIGGYRHMNVSWEAPLVKNGVITRYRIHIRSSGADYPRPSYCALLDDFDETIDYHLDENISAVTDSTERNLIHTVLNLRPFENYVVQVAAATKAGLGPYSEMVGQRTLPAQPDSVYEISEYNVTLPSVDEPYNSSVFVSWLLPCHLNGNLRSFIGQFIGFRAGLEHTLDWSLTIADGDVVSEKYTFVEHRLEPEFRYNVSIVVFVNDVANHSDPKFLSFDSPAGIPVIKDDVNWGTVDVMEAPNPTQTAKIILSHSIFDSHVGNIRHVALLLAERHCQEDPVPCRNLSTGWPDLRSWSDVAGMRCIAQYQTTPQEWSPVQVAGADLQGREQDPVVYVIGNETCDERVGYCNGPLKPGTEYALIVRVFTQSGFSDSPIQFFRTDSLIQLTVIVSIIFVCLLVAFILGIVVLWRSHKLVAAAQAAVRSPNDEPSDIPLKSFSGIYEELIQSNREKITKEYQSINYFSDQLLNETVTFFVGKENEKKNRYLGIIPYDGNRVLLDYDDIVGDEDEEVNDYINASFIDGYKYQREYIATQGPKKETSFDFWRMILQYEVESIVMLTQTVENDKIKCYQYFPRYSQQASFRDITIKCTQEMNLTFYQKRLLMVTRGNIRRAVFHYHFLVWPDHGCPASPTDLIKFIKIVRSERKNLALPVVVHCSAGVGRTGTLIALDIIIQRIQQEKKINIYDTVKQLRRQRVKMVQTCEQYAFLYQSCLEYTTRNGRKKPKTSNEEISTRSSLSSSVPNGSFRKPRINIKFPKYVQSGIANVKTYVPDDIETRS